MKGHALRIFQLTLVTLSILAAVYIPFGSVSAHTNASQAVKHQVPVSKPMPVDHPVPHSKQSFNCSGNNLCYHFGRVMGGTQHVYLIFWEPQWGVNLAYNGLITRYYQDVVGQGLYKNNTQYSSDFFGTPKATTLSATWLDDSKADAYPQNSTLSANDIQSEIQRIQKQRHWPTDGESNLFVVYTATGEVDCDQSDTCNTAPYPNGWCGEHESYGFSLKGGTIYAIIPYPTDSSQDYCLIQINDQVISPNNNPQADAAVSFSSHEQMEAATDPYGHGWYDNDGNEIGDKCTVNIAPPPLNYDNGQADVQWNGHYYIVQEEWDNKANNGQGECVLSGP